MNVSGDALMVNSSLQTILLIMVLFLKTVSLRILYILNMLNLPQFL